ncbi:hypothetical protein GQ457_05G029620 [Hibiscus cannabinus]
MTGYNTQVLEYAYDPCGNNHESSEVNVVGQELNAYMAEDDQSPTASTQMLYNILGASSEPIWPGSNESNLSLVSELIHLKAQYRIPNACYDDLCRIIQRNGCMIYWGCDSELSECKFWGHPRYKDNAGEGSSNRKAYKKMYYFPLTPRLQRLYASEVTAKHMRWHAEHQNDEVDLMCHPSDSFAWKYFDQEHPTFSYETRNVRLGLCTDGEVTYDLSTKQNFLLHAALLWTINDFPAYGMLSGWSTAGRTSCPYCMEESEAFTLQHGGKQSWFDNHRKFLPHNHHFRRNTTAFTKGKKVLNNPLPIKSGREILNEIDYWGFLKVTEPDAVEINGQLAQLSGWKTRSIFWDLPYWSSNLIRHNIDVMNVEKNVFENIFNTIMNVEGKTKDNAKSRADLQLYCDRPELANQDDFGKYPKASYTLDKQRQKVLCDWVQDLKFPDGFASNFARCVDMKKLKLFAMKRHDCHVFMQRLIPIAFQELLPRNVWETLTELNLFFKDLTSTVIKEADMRRLEKDITIILCKLERIFPPSFFDSMEHLPIHMAYEARIGGPVHYRWMYPFERFFRKLKGSIGNKAHVEGSICNSYETVEGSKFFHYYFPKVANTSSAQLMPNSYEEHPDILSIFAQHKAEMIGKWNERYLSDEEIVAAHTYILLNCTEVQESTNNIINIFLKALAMGPLRLVKSFSGYKVNGFKFRTMAYGSDKPSPNCGVCVKGSNYVNGESDYFGRLVEVIQIQYPGWPVKSIVLFKCEWFDPRPGVGTKINPKYSSLVEVNEKKRYSGNDIFVLEIQANQVYYVNYPSLRRDKQDWLAVIKIKARAIVDIPVSNNVEPESTSDPYQDDEPESQPIQIVANDEPELLIDDSKTQLNIVDVEVEDDSDEDEIQNEYFNLTEDD